MVDSTNRFVRLEEAAHVLHDLVHDLRQHVLPAPTSRNRAYGSTTDGWRDWHASGIHSCKPSATGPASRPRC
jgi:hypothetical protein